MSTNLLSGVKIECEPPAEACIIWLHGLGADGHDFEPVAKILLPVLPVRTRFILPHAPMRSVTMNGGMSMRAWYDMYGLDRETDLDMKTVAESDADITALIDAQIESGVPADKIVLAGFSQGGAIALYTGLRYPKRLAGIIALSTYLFKPGKPESSAANEAQNIFMAHGNSDPVVPLDFAQSAAERLKDAGHALEWYEYPMPHSVCQPEIEDIAAFLKQVL